MNSLIICYSLITRFHGSKVWTDTTPHHQTPWRVMARDAIFLENCWIWQPTSSHITLFRFILVFCRTNNNLQNILHIQSQCEEFSVEYYHSHKTMLWMWIMLYKLPTTSLKLLSHIVLKYTSWHSTSRRWFSYTIFVILILTICTTLFKFITVLCGIDNIL